MGGLSALRRRIDSLDQIQDVVAAMRALAASRARQSEQALAGVRAYTETVREALAVSLSLLGSTPALSAVPAPGPPIWIVFASEHGFVGELNQRVIDRVASRRAEEGGTVLLAGSRGRVLAADRGLEIADAVVMATRVDAVEETARRLLARFEDVLGEVAARIVLIHAAPTRAMRPQLVERSLWPLELADFRRPPPPVPPLHHLPPAELVHRFTIEYLMAALTDAAMQSFAAANRARLATTDTAHRQLERELTSLRGQARRLRQEEITAEIADILVGVEAVGDG